MNQLTGRAYGEPQNGIDRPQPVLLLLPSPMSCRKSLKHGLDDWLQLKVYWVCTRRGLYQGWTGLIWTANHVGWNNRVGRQERSLHSGSLKRASSGDFWVFSARTQPPPVRFPRQARKGASWTLYRWVAHSLQQCQYTRTLGSSSSTSCTSPSHWWWCLLWWR